VSVNADVMVIDEVLAVGDQAFQAKCLNKIDEIRRQGVTIVLVSHDLRMVRSMCERAIWLQDGRVMDDGDASSVVDAYAASVHAISPMRVPQS